MIKEKLFFIRSEVEEKVLSLITDGGSCNNMVSKKVIEKLGPRAFGGTILSMLAR